MVLLFTYFNAFALPELRLQKPLQAENTVYNGKNLLMRLFLSLMKQVPRAVFLFSFPVKQVSKIE